MAAITTTPTQIVYPTSDGEPVAETYDHLYAILMTLEVLRQYLKGQQATVLGNQFLYYAQGLPKLRVAPDVMVIFDVEPGGRDSYKVWEEGQVPRVIFEITSKSTQEQDTVLKKSLYEQLEVQEYWLFDPKGEWVQEQLRGYRLQGEVYVPIVDRRSLALNLRIEIDGKLLAFYREDTGEKLLLPDELAAALQVETQRRTEAEALAEQERQRAEQERQRSAELEILLERYRSQFGDLEE